MTACDTCVTTKPPPTLIHSAFYKFIRLQDVSAMVEQLKLLTQTLHGSILVAPEGVNGMVAGHSEAITTFQSAMLAMPAFNDIVFKQSQCTTSPFHKMKVRQKPEIVPLGIPGVDASTATGINVSPSDWRALIAQDDVVLLDNRNSFEYRLGRFKNAIDPGVANFRDFPAYVKAHISEWKANGKRVAMYCTGGIRCEKTSAWMQEYDLPVYQLEGGILNYFQTVPDAEKDWQGECFVFDNRIALDTHLKETSTTLEDVYEDEPDGEWRLQRARQLHIGED